MRRESMRLGGSAGLAIRPMMIRRCDDAWLRCEGDAGPSLYDGRAARDTVKQRCHARDAAHAVGRRRLRCTVQKCGTWGWCEPPSPSGGRRLPIIAHQRTGHAPRRRTYPVPRSLQTARGSAGEPSPSAVPKLGEPYMSCAVRLLGCGTRFGRYRVALCTRRYAAGQARTYMNTYLRRS